MRLAPVWLPSWPTVEAGMDTSVLVTLPVTLGAITTFSLLLSTACFTISWPMAVSTVADTVPPWVLAEGAAVVVVVPPPCPVVVTGRLEPPELPPPPPPPPVLRFHGVSSPVRVL